MITNPCTTAVITMTPSTSVTYMVDNPTLTIPFVFTDDQGFCGAWSFTVSNPDPSMITFLPGSQQVQVMTNDHFKIGTYNIVITGTL